MQLTEETGTNIELDDDGTVHLRRGNEAAMEAIRRIEAITRGSKWNRIYEGKGPAPG